MTSVDYQPVLHRFPQSAPVTMRRPAGDADQKTGAPETVKRGPAQADLTPDLRKAVNPAFDYPICPPGIFQLTGPGSAFSKITRWLVVSIRNRILSPGFQPKLQITSGGKLTARPLSASNRSTRFLRTGIKDSFLIKTPLMTLTHEYYLNCYSWVKKFARYFHSDPSRPQYIILNNNCQEKTYISCKKYRKRL